MLNKWQRRDIKRANRLPKIGQIGNSMMAREQLSKQKRKDQVNQNSSIA